MDTVKGVFDVITGICVKIKELKDAHEEFKKLEPSFNLLLYYSSELERYQELKNLEMGVQIALKQFAQDVKNVQATVNEAKKLEAENAGNAKKFLGVLNKQNWNNKFKDQFSTMRKDYGTFKEKLLEDKTPVGRLLLNSPTTGVFWSNSSCTNPINYLDFYDNLISYYPKFFTKEDKKHLLAIVVLMCDTKSKKTEEKQVSIASLLNFLYEEGTEFELQRYPILDILKKKLNEQSEHKVRIKEKQVEERSTSDQKYESKVETLNVRTIDWTSITAPIFQESKTKEITSSKLCEWICDEWIKSYGDHKYTKEYVQYYIEREMKSGFNKDKEAIVSESSVKIWLTEAERHKKSEKLLEVFIASFEKDHKKTVKSLYDAGKACCQKAENLGPGHPDFMPNIEKGKALFEIYRELVENNIDVGRTPEKDRHLLYLIKLDELPPNASASPWGESWDKWKKDHNIPDPKDKNES